MRISIIPSHRTTFQERQYNRHWFQINLQNFITKHTVLGLLMESGAIIATNKSSIIIINSNGTGSSSPYIHFIPMELLSIAYPSSLMELGHQNTLWSSDLIIMSSAIPIRNLNFTLWSRAIINIVYLYGAGHHNSL